MKIEQKNEIITLYNH